MIFDGKENNEPKILYANELQSNYPNPFNPITKINFSIKKISQVKLEIFNINGQLIRNLFDGEKNGGKYSINWDGRNSTGKLQASGVYFYRLRIGNEYDVSKKMILLR